jgi:hypothetical protein
MDVLLSEVALKIKTASSRQSDIDHEAGGDVRATRLEKVRYGRK